MAGLTHCFKSHLIRRLPSRNSSPLSQFSHRLLPRYRRITNRSFIRTRELRTTNSVLIRIQTCNIPLSQCIQIILILLNSTVASSTIRIKWLLSHWTWMSLEDRRTPRDKINLSRLISNTTIKPIHFEDSASEEAQRNYQFTMATYMTDQWCFIPDHPVRRYASVTTCLKTIQCC